MSVSSSSSWTRTLFFSSLFLFELDEEDLIEEECQTAEEEQEEEEVEEEEEEEEERVERFEEWVSFCGSSSRIEGRKLGESMEARRWNTAVR